MRYWSTVLRVPTDEDDVYFKASSPAHAFEAGLNEALARWRPDCVPKLLAVDAERGWMLMADGGTQLREQIQSVRDLGHWEQLLPLYAALQIDLSEHRDELLALGVPDERLASLPAQYERLLAKRTALLIDLPNGLTSDEYRRLQGLAPELAEMCAELTSYGIPESLQHDDFHDGQIFVREGRYVFFDWGDSCVSHPFHTLVVTLRSIAHRLELDPDTRELTRLTDAYLEPWTRYRRLEELHSALRLALRVGSLGRALAWHRFVSQMESPFKDEYADAVAWGLQRFLNDELLPASW